MTEKSFRGGVGDPPAFQLLNEVGIIDQLAQHRAGHLLAPELNMPQFIVLNHLVRRDTETSQIELARSIQVTKGAMSNTVTRLLEKGYITVRSDPDDGRGKRVGLSAEGRRARDRAVAGLAKELSDVGRLITPEELERTLETLRKLRTWFDAQRSGGTLQSREVRR